MSEAMADLTYPPDPFQHGPCSVEGCNNPAVFTGGVCAHHVPMPVKADPMLPVPGPHRWTPVEYAERKRRRKGADASRRRNRR